MQDDKTVQQAINTICAKSIETVHATESGHPGESLHPSTPVARRKRWSSARLITLSSLGAILVIVCLLRHVPAERLEGLGAALCVIACGGLLIRHLLRVMAEEDMLEEEQLNANQATVSHPEANPTGPRTYLTTPPEAGHNIK